MKRSGRLKPVSAKRLADRPRRDEVRALVLARDFNRCRLSWLGSCGGLVHVHHLRKASAGGHFDPFTLIACCDRHNTAIEDNPDWAHSLGLVVRMGETIGEAWERMYEAGLSSSPEPGSPPNFR